MTPVTRYLLTTSILFLLALGAGCLVWYLYQNLDGARPGEYLEKEVVVESVDNKATTEENSPTTSVSTAPEPIRITADSLSEKQRAMLSSFGFAEASITITESTITCAQEAVGETRLTEIIDGAAPSPLEAMKLLPCLKK